MTVPRSMKDLALTGDFGYKIKKEPLTKQTALVHGLLRRGYRVRVPVCPQLKCD